jgi:nucleoside-diphosphate-sugar epimerase
MTDGFPAVVVRPGLVYGPGDLHLVGFFRAIQRGLFRPIGREPVWFHPVYVNDLSDAFIACAVNPRASGECFHIAGRQPMTVAALAETIAAALGVPAPRGTIPTVVARALATAGDLLPAPLRHLAPLTSSRLDFLTGSRVYDVSKAQRLLGFVASTDLSDGIARTVDWYRQAGYLRSTRHGSLVGAAPMEADR